MESLYVIGGQQRTPRGMLVDEDVWYEYGKGVIMRVDPSSGNVTTSLEYVSPPHACAEHEPQVLFKSATVHDDRLYACTQTEVIVYSLPELEQLVYISLPCFNDLHHVRPTPEGNLLIANSGLDMVLEISHEGEVLREWSTLGEDPWSRFSRDIDYRKGVSTKPHKSHPNYVFYVGDEPWATRFQQRDAISLTNPERRIEVGLERMHDGVVSNGHVYFTTVDGKVVVADHERLLVEQVIDLNAMHEDEALLGWCRSLHLDGDTRLGRLLAHAPHEVPRERQLGRPPLPAPAADAHRLLRPRARPADQGDRPRGARPERGVQHPPRAGRGERGRASAGNARGGEPPMSTEAPSKSLSGKGLMQSVGEWSARNDALSAALSELVRTHGPADGGLGLDVGCQNGALTDAWERLTDLHWTGIDPGIAELRQSEAGLDLHPGWAHELPFPDAHFDCAIFANV